MRIQYFLPLALLVGGMFLFPAAGQEKEFDPFSAEAADALQDIFDAADAERSFLEPDQVRNLARSSRPSLVTVRQLGRDGKGRGTGSGFIVSEDGLVVTNLHVIGEGRSIEVELDDGSVLPATGVHAWDRRYDLAVIRIDVGKRKLVALPIADSESVEQGQLVVGFGAPQGLSFSVVAGVVSAIRKLDPGFVGESETPDFPMLQLAMPIEQGNSGGPVINLAGEVVGVVTLRHRVTENLGFAVPSNDLSLLLEKPNSVPMARWRTIGVLDPRLWTPVMGADWSQKGGLIQAKSLGDGFGGRSLCLSSRDVPEVPYEVAVQVRLDEEAGAAGLAFASDGGDKHYGFYPSGGQIRLTRFEGPDVYSWSILEQLSVPAYRPGEWNHLRVRVEEKTITGWVNDEKVLEIEDDGLRGGKVGLCKFRQTEAQFRGLTLEREIRKKTLSPQERERLGNKITLYLDEQEPGEVVRELSRESDQGRELLLERAEELEELALRLRGLEAQVHRQIVINELVMALERPPSEVDLFEVGLQIARVDDPDLDLDHYRVHFSRLVTDARSYLEEHALEGTVPERVEALRDFLFRENGFHGSRTEYYHRANSYVNQVLDDREGLPITLSVIFLEMARRLQIPGVYGAPLPGKFMVGVDSEEDGETETLFIDVFDNGNFITRRGAAREIWKLLGAGPDQEAFQAAVPRDIAVRMLRNLVGLEINRKQNPEGAEDYLELLLAIHPEAAQERFQRALLRIQEENIAGAKEDLDWLLEHRPPGIDYSRLEIFRGTLPLE